MQVKSQIPVIQIILLFLAVGAIAFMVPVQPTSNSIIVPVYGTSQ